MVQITGGDKLEKALAEIAQKVSKASEVDIGFLSGATYPDGTSVAFVAAMNEFGHRIGSAPEEGEEDTRESVPPRPFFRDMIAEKSKEWPAAVGNLLVANGYDAEKTMGQTGEAIKGQLQESIVRFDKVPLAPSTIAAKGNDKQLVDTGTMLNSVGYEVKE